MQRVEHRACFGGWQDVYRHRSTALGLRHELRRLPAAAGRYDGPCPVLYWLSGLTCTEQNFITKAGAQRYAAEHGVILVAPDTSPRGDDVADADGYDLGQGAGFYVNATQAPWAAHYRMYDYVVDELPALDRGEFPGHRRAQHQRPLDGRARCAGRSRCATPAATAACRRSRRSSRRSQVPWGEKALRRLPRR